MPNLFPEGYEEAVVSVDDVTEDKPVGYKASIFFDEELQDLTRDGQYRVGSASGIDAWEQWCINCIQTERDVYPSYGEFFGIKTIEALATNDRQKTESILTREICEGLQNDPYGRTEYVSNIVFDWSGPDELDVTVTVRGIDDVTIDITATINMRAR